MKRNQDIWVGDLFRSWKALAPGDDATCEALANLLGFEWQSAAPETEKPGLPTQPSERPRTRFKVRRPPQVTSPPSVQEPAQDPQATELPLIDESTRDEAQTREWDAIQTLAPPAPSLDQYPMTILPLFQPEWSRTIATTLASRRLPIGAIDEDRLVEIMATAQPVQRIPRRPRWSISLGLQLLMDMAPGMEPFAADQIALTQLFSDCVGELFIDECLFSDNPLRGLFGELDIIAYRPPQPGVPVVAVTDLGLGGPASHVNRAQPEEWLALAQLLNAQDSPLTLLVPWPRHRLPSELLGRIAIVEWDRPTSAVRARRLLEQING